MTVYDYMKLKLDKREEGLIVVTDINNRNIEMYFYSESRLNDADLLIDEFAKLLEVKEEIESNYLAVDIKSFVIKYIYKFNENKLLGKEVSVDYIMYIMENFNKLISHKSGLQWWTKFIDSIR